MGPGGGVQLGGVDVFHVRLHQEMRRRGLAGNGCSLVLELAGRLDPAALAARLEAATALVEELRWRLGRDARLQPVWRPRSGPFAPPLTIRTLGAGETFLDAATALLDEPVDGGRPWGLRLVRGPTADALVWHWFHPLADARGAERLLTWLGAGEGAEPPAPPPASERFGRAEQRFADFADAQRWPLLRAYRRHVLGVAERPIASLAAVAGRRAIGRTRAVRRRLSPAESQAFTERARARTGLAEAHLLAFGVARLLDAALTARGRRPERYSLVVPASLDAGQGCQRMFGNHLTMMMLTLDRADLADSVRALRSLGAQRRVIVRERLDAAFVLALGAARYLPAPIYSWFSRRPFGGERMSALVTDPGLWSIDAFLGVPVTDAYPVPSVALPPGLELVASRHRGRLSLAVLFVESVIGCDEVAERLAALERDLLAPP